MNHRIKDKRWSPWTSQNAVTLCFSYYGLASLRDETKQVEEIIDFTKSGTGSPWTEPAAEAKRLDWTNAKKKKKVNVPAGVAKEWAISVLQKS